MGGEPNDTIATNNRLKAQTNNETGVSPAPSSPRSQPAGPSRWPWVLVALVILAAAAIRGRLLDFPLERDEGEYAYVAQLMLQGVPPYQSAVTMKLPGTHALYAVFLALFGQTAAGIHLGLLLIHCLTILLIFMLGRRLYDATAGVMACAAYAVLSVNFPLLGFAAHATHFVNFFALAGAVLLLRSADSGRGTGFFLSGLLFGLAVLMKQHGACFALFGLIYLLWSEWRSWLLRPQDGSLGVADPRVPSITRSFGRIGLFCLGVALPFGITCVVLAFLGVFEQFWFCTITYARNYVTMPTLEEGLDGLLAEIGDLVGPDLLLWVLAGIGLMASWFRPRAAIFLTGWLISSVAAVSLGFYFRPHYFLMLLPALALLDGTAIALFRRAWLRYGLGGRAGRAIPALVFLAAVAWPLAEQWEFLFKISPIDACWETYAQNPFVESQVLAQYIRERTAPEDTIVVFGSEPELFFYAGRRSATRHIYMYPLLEEHPSALEMGKEMTRDIEASQPKFFIVVAVHNSWKFGPNSDKSFMDRGRIYKHKHFDLVGLIEVRGPLSAYHWGPGSGIYQTRSRYFIQVYQRKAEDGS
jgi:4-amino-4-deoxy-L-arabinose transferase-like glycosyltransferase